MFIIAVARQNLERSDSLHLLNDYYPQGRTMEMTEVTGGPPFARTLRQSDSTRSFVRKISAVSPRRKDRSRVLPTHETRSCCKHLVVDGFVVQSRGPGGARLEYNMAAKFVTEFHRSS